MNPVLIIGKENEMERRKKRRQAGRQAGTKEEKFYEVLEQFLFFL